MPVLIEFLRLKLVELWKAIRWLGEFVIVILALIVFVCAVIGVGTGVVAGLGAGLFTLSSMTGVLFDFFSKIYLNVPRDGVVLIWPFMCQYFMNLFFIGMLGISVALVAFMLGMVMCFVGASVKELFGTCCQFFKDNWAQATKNVAARCDKSTTVM